MARVITFGEIMLRLAPEGYYRFVAGRDFLCRVWRRRSKCGSFTGKLWN